MSITKNKSIFIIIAVGILVAVIAFISLSKAFADYTGNLPSGYTKPADITSQGRMVFAGDDEQLNTSDDVVFDAQDIYYLYDFCQ